MPTKADFNSREWDSTIDRVCGLVEFPIEDMTEYQFGLIYFIGLSRLTARENKPLFKANWRMRKELSMWVREFGQYQEFAEGTWLLCKYYSVENVLKSDYWTLLQMLTRWQSCVSISMYYGNKHQIERFVPVAQKHIAEITERMMRMKCKSSKPITQPSQWDKSLDADIVRAKVDALRIYEYYMPDLKKVGRVHKACCLWHTDSNPSFVVYDDGHGHCFVCGHHVGGIYDLVMERERVDFPTSIVRALEIGG